MKTNNHIKKFATCATSAVMAVTLLATVGCGSDDKKKSSSGEEATTTFNISVDVPAGLSSAATNARAKATDLAAENFKITILNAAGEIIEVIDVNADNFERLADGTYELVIPGDPRFDCIVIVDPTKPLVIQDNTIPAGTIYAPTTSTEIDVDVKSSIAYQEFLEDVTEAGTFELGLSIEEVDAFVDKVQELDLPTPTGDQTLEEFIAAALEVLEETVNTMVDIAKQPAVTTTVADIFTGEDGIGAQWLDGEYDDDDFELEYGNFGYKPSTQMTFDQWNEYYAYIGNGQWSEEDGSSNDSTGQITFATGSSETAVNEAFELSATNGWVASKDLETVMPNSDGTVTLTSDGGSTATGAGDVVSVAGLNIASVLRVAGVEAWPEIVNSSATFPDGALMLNMTFTQNETYYAFDCEDANVQWECSEIYSHSVGDLALTLESLKNGSMSVWDAEEFGHDEVIAEFNADNTSITFKDWVYDENAGQHVSTETLGTVTTETITQGNVSVLVVNIPTLFQNALGYSSFGLTEYDGKVRRVDIEAAGSVESESLFNKVALDAVLANYNLKNINLEQCDTGDLNNGTSTLATFNTAVDNCELGGAKDFTTAIVAGKSYSISGEGTAVFNADGTGDYTPFVIVVGEDEADTFDWTITDGRLIVSGTDADGDWEDTLAITDSNGNGDLAIKALWGDEIGSELWKLQ